MDHTAVEVLAKQMADRIGHGMEEKCLKHAEVAIEQCTEYNTLAVMDLHTAYKNAKTNAECANILRLFCTDFKEFQTQYGHTLQNFLDRQKKT